MRTLTALLLAAAAFAATAADLPATNSVRADAIRGHVEFLASDLLEGRAAATRGYDIAAAYVAAQFRQAGLAPAGDENTYLQTVPLAEAHSLERASDQPGPRHDQHLHQGDVLRGQVRSRQLHLRLDLDSGGVLDLQDLLAGTLDEQDVAGLDHRARVREDLAVLVPHDPEDVEVELLAQARLAQGLADQPGVGEHEHLRQVGAHAERLHELARRGAVGDQAPADEASSALSAVIERVLDRLADEPDGSALAWMLGYDRDGDRMSRDEIVANTKLMLSGGLQEPRDLIALAVLALGAHPEQLEEVRSEPRGIKAAVEAS